MQQSIIWTNADPLHRHIYATIGGDDVNIKNTHAVLVGIMVHLMMLFIHVTWVPSQYKDVVLPV